MGKARRAAVMNSPASISAPKCPRSYAAMAAACALPARCSCRAAAWWHWRAQTWQKVARWAGAGDRAERAAAAARQQQAHGEPALQMDDDGAGGNGAAAGDGAGAAAEEEAASGERVAAATGGSTDAVAGATADCALEAAAAGAAAAEAATADEATGEAARSRAPPRCWPLVALACVPSLWPESISCCDRVTSSGCSALSMGVRRENLERAPDTDGASKAWAAGARGAVAAPPEGGSGERAASDTGGTRAAGGDEREGIQAEAGQRSGAATVAEGAVARRGSRGSGAAGSGLAAGWAWARAAVALQVAAAAAGGVARWARVRCRLPARCCWRSLRERAWTEHTEQKGTDAERAGSCAAGGGAEGVAASAKAAAEACSAQPSGTAAQSSAAHSRHRRPNSTRAHCMAAGNGSEPAKRRRLACARKRGVQPSGIAIDAGARGAYRGCGRSGAATGGRAKQRRERAKGKAAQNVLPTEAKKSLWDALSYKSRKAYSGTDYSS